MRRLIVLVVALAVAVGGALVLWRRNPRMGTRFVNERLNPLLVGKGISGAGRSEVGTLEHLGRVSGERHLTPVHPIPTPEGFRILVPLGPESQWARNVVAAGHCRIQLHDTVHELDEPVMLAPDEIPDIAPPLQWLATRLGFEYLLLRRFAERPGTLDEPEPATLAEAPQLAGVAPG
jgi:hypothetical protein